jgi:hypothetical protein
MQALDYLLPQPPFDLSPEKQAEFDALFTSIQPGGLIDYRLAHPKWQFLSYLCQSSSLVLHGSQNVGITEVEPRQAMDVRAYSGQNAIYATTDGIWVIFFAIIDRKKFSPLSLFNSCLDIRISPEQTWGPFYFFSITHSALVQEPWCEGSVYILPREGFVQEPAQPMMGAEIVFPHWIGRKPTQPIARLTVGPQDFPFLAAIHGHDDEKLTKLASKEPDGFPWPAALVCRGSED